MPDAERLTKPADPPPPRRIVEALLFVGNAPLTAVRAGEVIRNLSAEQFRAIIDELNRDYRKQSRPYIIQAKDDGFVLTLKPAFRGVIDRMQGSPREARLTPGARDALALIAYRQPIRKTEIDSQRGQDSRGSLQQLLRLGLIAVDANQPESKDFAYLTTDRFLELVGLKSLDELPKLGELQRL
jgi:segregation and condensation protein B